MQLNEAINKGNTAAILSCGAELQVFKQILNQLMCHTLDAAPVLALLLDF